MTESITNTKRNLIRGAAAFVVGTLAAAGLAHANKSSGEPTTEVAAVRGNPGPSPPTTESSTTSSTTAVPAIEATQVTPTLATARPETIRVAPPITASTAPSSENNTRQEISPQAMHAYAAKVISDARNDKAPVIQLDCDREIYATPLKGGPEVAILNGLRGNRFTVNQNPNAAVTDGDSFVAKYDKKVDPATGKVVMNPDGTPEFTDSIFIEGKTHTFRYKVNNNPPKICLATVEKIGSYSADQPMGVLIGSPELRVAIGAGFAPEPTLQPPLPPGEGLQPPEFITDTLPPPQTS